MKCTQYHPRLNAFKTKAPINGRFPVCNDAEIDLYMRMPTNAFLVESKAGRLLDLLGEEDAILETISPEIGKVRSFAV